MFQARKSLFKPNLDFKPHLLNPFDTEHREKNSSKIQHFEVGNIVALLKVGFHDLRNKSPAHLLRSFSEPP